MVTNEAGNLRKTVYIEDQFVLEELSDPIQVDNLR